MNGRPMNVSAMKMPVCELTAWMPSGASSRPIQPFGQGEQIGPGALLGARLAQQEGWMQGRQGRHGQAAILGFPVEPAAAQAEYALLALEHRLGCRPAHQQQVARARFVRPRYAFG